MDCCTGDYKECTSTMYSACLDLSASEKGACSGHGPRTICWYVGHNCQYLCGFQLTHDIPQLVRVPVMLHTAYGGNCFAGQVLLHLPMPSLQGRRHFVRLTTGYLDHILRFLVVVVVVRIDIKLELNLLHHNHTPR